MKHFFNSLMLLILAGITVALVFVIKPQFIEDATHFFDSSDATFVEKVTAFATTPPEPKSKVFPYSKFETSLVPTLEGNASTSKKIIADLEAMKIYLYIGDTLEQEIDIKSRGRVSTFWETPPGAYQIELKERNHFSSIGHVWMPYSMHFFGNYFIHGWPYYADGTEVGEGYSGGCIRLTTDDAKIVYDFADKYTPLYVFSVHAAPVSAGYTPTIESTLELSASGHIVSDISTGQIISEKESSTQIPLGTITSVMTALISLEALNQYNEAVLSDIEAESSLVPGTRLEILDILTYIVLKSDVRAADTLAHYIGPKWFTRNMNKKAEAIGLTQTEFSDAFGENEKNISSAHDMLVLLNYVYNNKVYLTKLSKTASKETAFETVTNDNPFLAYKNFEGGFVSKKIGETQNASLLFTTGEEKDAHVIAIVLTGSNDVEADVTKILTALKK